MMNSSRFHYKLRSFTHGGQKVAAAFTPWCLDLQRVEASEGAIAGFGAPALKTGAERTDAKLGTIWFKKWDPNLNKHDLFYIG